MTLFAFFKDWTFKITVKFKRTTNLKTIDVKGTKWKYLEKEILYLVIKSLKIHSEYFTLCIEN